jgi:RNA polymerase sigma-70 factor (ECF subfamily)
MEPDAAAVGVPGVETAMTEPASPPLPAVPMSDADGAAGLAGGATASADDLTVSPEPFVDFYERTRDPVGRALAITLGDAHLAADAVDEAMARAYQRWDRIGRFVNPGGWVYRVGLNWATSVLRRRRRAPQPLVERGPMDVGPVAEPAVAAALAELPPRQRAVIVCRFYLGLTEAETATALATRPGTVKSRLHRALRHLETRLSHLAPEDHR